MERKVKAGWQGRIPGKSGEKEIYEKDPLNLFKAWLKEARSKSEHEPEAMALATADEEGRPAVRMVLYKEVNQDGFCFFTNYGSRKALHLAANPYASLLFYWPGLYRQVRIEGKVRKAASKISDDYFDSRPLGSRISASISPQSAVVPDRMFLEAMHESFAKDLGKNAPQRPSNWGGYILTPDRIEFWTGRDNRLHDRILYSKSKSAWIIERLAP